MECLSEHPAERPTAAQLLQRVGQLVERRGPPPATQAPASGEEAAAVPEGDGT